MSDQFATLNGDRITSGRVTVPYYGIWVADLVLASTDALPSAGDTCTVTLGGLTLKGTAYRSSPFAGARSARVVGGAGGWRKSLPERAYGFSGGVLLSLVMGDAARAVGETIALGADASLGAAYVRARGPALTLLRELCTPLWWVGTDGVTRVASTRPVATIKSDFQVIHQKGDAGWFEIATESQQDWVPGATFTSPTVTGSQTISMATYVADNGGKLRVEVLATGAANV